MEIVVLSVHLLVSICLVGLVLLQRSEGGALGIGGGGGSLMSGRGAADALARMTSVAGGFFLVTSLSLTVLSGANASSDGRSVFDNLQPQSSAPAAPAPTLPSEPPASERPDPTESSIPADAQLASIAPGPAGAAASPPADAARAAPLTSPPPTTRSIPAAPQPTGANTQPRPAADTQQRAGAATTPTASTTRPLVLPNTSGAVTGIPLEEAQTEPESVEVGNGVEAVRRNTRAGPDQ